MIALYTDLTRKAGWDDTGQGTWALDLRAHLALDPGHSLWWVEP